MKEIKFVVNGDPHGKGRPRFSRFGNYVKAYTDKDTLSYENRVLMCYKQELSSKKRYSNIEVLFPKGTLVKMVVSCYFSLNKGDYGKKGLNKSGKEKLSRCYCDKKPDIDNIIKSIQDGLNGVAYSDDNQIVCLEAYKIYTEEQSRVEITLQEIGIFTE